MTEFNKAVRDRIPEIIKNSGVKCNFRALENDEFLEKLDEKLIEELKEYQESKSVEELADIMEVIYRISSLKGTAPKQLDEIRKGKANDRGAFEKNLYLVSTDD